MTTATKQWTAAQAKAAAKWAKEMGALDPERTGAWTASEVGEYHSAGIIGVCEPERARLDQLFVNAGGERVLAAWLSVQTDERWTAGGAEIEILSVRDEEPHGDEGRACWVMARVNGVRVRLYACPHPDGRPGLEPCGDSLDAWCDDALRAYGDDVARDLGEEVIARVG